MVGKTNAAGESKQYTTLKLDWSLGGDLSASDAMWLVYCGEYGVERVDIKDKNGSYQYKVLQGSIVMLYLDFWWENGTPAVYYDGLTSIYERKDLAMRQQNKCFFILGVGELDVGETEHSISGYAFG